MRTFNNSCPWIDDVDNEPHWLVYDRTDWIDYEKHLIIDLGSAESIIVKGSIDFQVESFPDDRKEERGDEPTWWSPGYFISWVKCRHERTTGWSSQWFWFWTAPFGLMSGLWNVRQLLLKLILIATLSCDTSFYYQIVNAMYCLRFF